MCPGGSTNVDRWAVGSGQLPMLEFTVGFSFFLALHFIRETPCLLFISFFVRFHTFLYFLASVFEKVQKSYLPYLPEYSLRTVDFKKSWFSFIKLHTKIGYNSVQKKVGGMPFTFSKQKLLSENHFLATKHKKVNMGFS